MDFAEEIKAYLKRNNMSQKKLAELADVQPGNLCDYLRGYRKNIGPDSRKRIKDVLAGKNFHKICNPPEECFVCKYPDCIRQDDGTKEETMYIKAAKQKRIAANGHIPQGKLSSRLRSGWM